jgi:hypothetical protein
MQTPPLNQQYIIVIILYAISYVYSLIFSVKIKDETDGIFGRINDLNQKCFVNCKDVKKFNIDCSSLIENHGENYYIGMTNPENFKSVKTCLITFWGVTHFILYTFIGYFAPDLFLETFIIGAAFELYEKEEFNCHDLLDLVLNSAGFAAGYFLRRISSL